MEKILQFTISFSIYFSICPSPLPVLFLQITLACWLIPVGARMGALLCAVDYS